MSRVSIKSRLAKSVVFALLGLVCFAMLVKVVSLIKQPDTQNILNSTQLLLEYREVVASGVSSDEKDRIVSFVDTFARAIAQKDTEEVLSFFSEPETGEEQNELDFLLGVDLAAHYAREVRKDGARVQVIVDELRVTPSGGEWAGYSAKVSRVVVELRETSHGYEIVRYYHYQVKSSGRDSKYEGFIAE